MRNIFTYVIIVAFSTLSISIFASEKYSNDSIPNIIKTWRINPIFSFVDSTNFDTSLIDIQSALPFYNQTYYPLWLGNYGLPFMLNFNGIQSSSKFPSTQNLAGYFLTELNQQFFNTRKPITEINYYNSGDKNSKGQILKILHTQNISPDINVGFRVLFNHSLGSYKNQEAKNTSFGLWNSIQKEKYELFTGFNYNKFKVQENGGFLNDSVFESGSYNDSKYIEVNLDGAKSTNYYNELYLKQKYRFKKANLNKDTTISILSGLSVVHNLKWKRSARMYEDSEPSSGYYQQIYLDSFVTLDSTALSLFYNSFSVMLDNKDSETVYELGFFNSLENYYSGFKDSSISNYGVLLALRGSSGNKNLDWGSVSNIILFGAHKGSFLSNLNVKYKFTNDTLASYIRLKFISQREYPSPFLINYSSNNFDWNNDFNPMNFNKLEAIISWPGINTFLNMRSGIISDYIYYNIEAIPSQFDEQIIFLSAELKNDLYLNKVTLSNRIIYQKSSNMMILPLPELSYKGTLKFETYLFKGEMFGGVGVDMSYYSSYFAQAYMPALGVYHIQDEKEIGNYPYFDVYIKAKVKNLRLLFKYQHVNEGLGDNTYYSALHYSAPPRQFVFGLSWIFYN